MVAASAVLIEKGSLMIKEIATVSDTTARPLPFLRSLHLIKNNYKWTSKSS
jgi:hypothetical protein